MDTRGSRWWTNYGHPVLVLAVGFSALVLGQPSKEGLGVVFIGTWTMAGLLLAPWAAGLARTVSLASVVGLCLLIQVQGRPWASWCWVLLVPLLLAHAALFLDNRRSSGMGHRTTSRAR